MGLTTSADGALHLLRLVVLDHHVRQGTLYPRWAPELFTGLGYPVFNFYGPFAYYLAELLHLLGLDFVTALMATFALFVLAGGFGMYRLAADVLGPRQNWAALVAATAYMLAPYLLTNVYIRGAIAEVGAQAWLPWIFWSTRRLLTAPRPGQYVLAVALTLAGLAVTHNITLLFTPVVLLAYVLVIWWQTGRPRARLGWAVGSIAAAVGASAFFWLPLIGERQLLAESAYKTAAIYLPENVWTWRNFLDTSFAFEHTFDVPFQLGLAQLLLALTGIIVARRRDPEWLYFITLAVLAGLGISTWSLPLWLGSETLLVAQFPWRLLTFMSLSLALFSGAILIRLPRERYRFAGACVLVSLIVLANRPEVGWMSVLARAGESITLPAIAQFEFETGAIGTGSAQEFRPRWSVGVAYQPSTADLAVDDRQITVEQADPHSLRLAVSSPQGGPLRFTSLYYPAWRATLADGSSLPTYPSTNLGLLAVDLPPGEHEIYLRWEGTDVQRLATWVSLATLAILTVFSWRTNRPRWLAAVPLALLALGLAATLVRPSLADVQPPSQPITSRSLAMVGYRLEQRGQHDLHIYPYWYTRQRPSENTMLRWQLRDLAGQVVSEATSRPYFNSQVASNWPAGTLVDDVYRLALPPGLAAGSYQLAVQVIEDTQQTDWIPVGTVPIESPIPAQSEPTYPLQLGFGQMVELLGFDLGHDGRTGESPPASPLVVRPGDNLELDLYWRALQALPTNYHSFIHLVDQRGEPVAKQDQLAGSFFRPPMLWDTLTLQPDRYSLRIPKDTPTGMYWPMVGLYEFETVALLPVTDAGGQHLGDTYRLPPIKVLRKNPSVKPQHQVNAKLGDLATLLGYDLALPEGGLRPGTQFSVTLHYQVNAATSQDLTQFIQLFSPDLGMAAQQDAPPQDGANPTWAWAPGEIVVDTRTLQVRADATPGAYQLLAGLYDPADGARLPVTDAQRNALPGGYIALTDLSVAP
jgi:hypothetical protein